MEILEQKNNLNNIRKLILAALMWTVIFLLFSYYLAININEDYNFIISKDFNTINILMAIIAIPSAWLYYYMYKNEEFYIFILSFSSIFLEYVVINNVMIDIIPNYPIIGVPFLFRVILLTFAIFHKNKLVKKLLNNKKRFAVIIIIMHIIFIYFEIKLKYIYRNNLNYTLMLILNIVIISYYYLLLTVLVKRALEQNKFIYMIFFSSISIFTFRRVEFLLQDKNNLNVNIEYSRILSFVGFSIILLGLFIEVAYKIRERDQLIKSIEKNEKKINSIQEDLRELREVEKIRSQFLANISHEFKTPINIIFSCIQLLDLKKNSSDLELAASYKRYDKTLKQNCNRMLRLINNLVDLTKMDAGYMTLNFINCNIIDLVENITLSVIPYIDNKKLNIIFDTVEEELYIKCAPEAIERVMLNLLSNAIKFTPNGGNILVFIKTNEDSVSISVKDDGIGISQEYLDIIFERFIQGDKSLKRETEGSGIGLSLVKSLIDMHKGTITVNSTKGKGSEFTINLPNNKYEESEEDDFKRGKSSSDNLVQRIDVEFSDIYDL